MTSSKTNLILLAHNDDEVFLLPFFDSINNSDENWEVIYFTHGSVSGIDPQIRIDESIRFFRTLDINVNIRLYGSELKIYDGSLMHHMEKTLKNLLSDFLETKIHRLIFPCWEGGHTDHDATHLIGSVFSNDHPSIVKSLNFPLYNSFNIVGPFFRVMKTIPKNHDEYQAVQVSIFRIPFYVYLISIYKSQKITFAALLPGILWTFLFTRKITFTRFQKSDYSEKPHPGFLFYEKRFKVSFQTFRECTKDFIQKHLYDNSN